MRILHRDRLERLWRRVEQYALGDDYTRSDGRCMQPPEWLVLCINNSCSLKCKMCDVGLGDHAVRGRFLW